MNLMSLTSRTVSEKYYILLVVDTGFHVFITVYRVHLDISQCNQSCSAHSECTHSCIADSECTHSCIVHSEYTHSCIAHSECTNSCIADSELCLAESTDHSEIQTRPCILIFAKPKVHAASVSNSRRNRRKPVN